MESEVMQNLFGVDSGLVTVAHELKTPLCLIRQLALTLNNDLSGEEIEKIAAQMTATSDRALKMVNELVKVARLDDALFDLEPVNPKRICETVLMELEDYYILNHRRLNVRYLNHPKLVVANAELLSSVIYNLCSNAVYYSAEETPSEVFIKTVDFGRKIRIGVRDFGPSLPMNIYRHLKNGFLKAPTSIAMRPGSSGMGLYIASKFTRHMNGRLGAVRHNDGTTLFVDLAVSGQRSLF